MTIEDIDNRVDESVTYIMAGSETSHRTSMFAAGLIGGFILFIAYCLLKTRAEQEVLKILTALGVAAMTLIPISIYSLYKQKKCERNRLRLDMERPAHVLTEWYRVQCVNVKEQLSSNAKNVATANYHRRELIATQIHVPVEQQCLYIASLIAELERALTGWHSSDHENRDGWWQQIEVICDDVDKHIGALKDLEHKTRVMYRTACYNLIELTQHLAIDLTCLPPVPRFSEHVLEAVNVEDAMESQLGTTPLKRAG